MFYLNNSRLEHLKRRIFSSFIYLKIQNKMFNFIKRTNECKRRLQFFGLIYHCDSIKKNKKIFDLIINLLNIL